MSSSGLPGRSSSGTPNAGPALQLATIAEVSAKVADARSCEAIVRVLVSEARWLLTFSRCALVLATEPGTLRVCTEGNGASRQESVIPLPTGGPTEWVLTQRQPLRVDNLQASWPGAEKELEILGQGARSALILPLTLDKTDLGALVFTATRAQAYPAEVLSIARLLSLQVASAVRTALLLEELDGQENVIVSLALAIEAKDPYTQGHCARLAEYAALLGQDLGHSERDLARLRMAAMLHDVGKITIPEELLCKPAALTDEEQRLFRTHPVVGEKICRPLRSARSILPGIRHHHEQWDGRGYPDGLRGEEIPLAARIIAIVDAFDAMSSDRPYRRGRSAVEALEVLRANRGPQWDPALVERFVPLMGRRLVRERAAQPIALSVAERQELRVARGG